jgi:hypothetical protein
VLTKPKLGQLLNPDNEYADIMEAAKFIFTYRREMDPEALDGLAKRFCFTPIERKDGIKTDENLRFRTEVTDALLTDFSLKDIWLIRQLFKEELKCEREIWRHDNLYQLSFYLYSLGQLEDTFLLYEAKYGILHMDSSIMQDRTSLTVGHEIDEVIQYVRDEFEKKPALQKNYPELVNELQNLKDKPDYDSVADYTLFLRGYFYGHEKVSGRVITDSHTTEKPWWKFW